MTTKKTIAFWKMFEKLYHLAWCSIWDSIKENAEISEEHRPLLIPLNAMVKPFNDSYQLNSRSD
jgi:hypothetical protein